MTQEKNEEQTKQKRRRGQIDQPPRGRPRIEITQAQIQQLVAGVARGLTIRDMALILGIGHATLERRIADERSKSLQGKGGKDNLYEAIERGRAVLKGKLFQKASDMALSDRSPSAQVLIFLLKSRYGLKETTILEGNKEAPLVEAPSKKHIESVLKDLLKDVRKKGKKFE